MKDEQLQKDMLTSDDSKDRTMHNVVRQMQRYTALSRSDVTNCDVLTSLGLFGTIDQCLNCSYSQ